jgi:potassium-transporting ATPase KdpC subunit
MKKHLVTSLLYTLITAVLLGVVYPLFVTGVAHVLFRDKTNGQLTYNAKGQLVGSKLIGQPFTGAAYFHSRPSAAGTGYDAQSSSGSNLGPTSKALADRVQQSVTSESTPNGGPIPVDLVTASGSGLDPDITPAAAFYQVARIAPLRGLSAQQLHGLVQAHIQPRQFGFLGEPRVNVLELNLALDAAHPAK